MQAQVVHYTTQYDDDDEDNFDEISKQLLANTMTAPTSYDVVRNAIESGQHRNVVLWRGTTGQTAGMMQQNGTAGRGAFANHGTTPPVKQEAKKQVQKGASLPEFTSDPTLTGYSYGHWLTVVRINTQYLTLGSSENHESGFVARPDAPATVLATVDRTNGQPEKKGINAS